MPNRILLKKRYGWAQSKAGGYGSPPVEQILEWGLKRNMVSTDCGGRTPRAETVGERAKEGTCGSVWWLIRCDVRGVTAAC